MNDEMYGVNLPESMMQGFENNQPIFTDGTIGPEDFEPTQNLKDSMKKDTKIKNFNSALFTALVNIKEKDVKATAKVKTKSKPKGKLKPAPSPAKTTITVKAKGKSMSKKQENLKRMIDGLTSLEATQTFNKKTGKNEVSVLINDKAETIYEYKGKGKFAHTLINNINGRGAILESLGITSLNITLSTGENYTLNRGDEKPKKPKKPKGIKATGEKAESTFKSFKVKAYGGASLKGLEKDGTCIEGRGQFFQVEFPNKKLGTRYVLGFSKKDGSQIDGNPNHCWKLNLKEVSAAMKSA